MSPAGPWNVAHRGASHDRPENTCAAFDEALRQGCDAIELDLQLSRDGVPVVYHDRTLKKAGGGRKRVIELSAVELRKLNAAEDWEGIRRQRIPTLEQVLERYAERTHLLLEIKTGRSTPERELELARAVTSAVRRGAAGKWVLILCFDPRVLDECKAAAPELPRVLNLRPPATLGSRLRHRLDDLYALCADVRTLTRRFASELRRAGHPLFVFTCNTPGRVTQALDAGAQGVISDKPGWLAHRIGGD